MCSPIAPRIAPQIPIFYWPLSTIWRIIPSRFPPIDVFERVTDAADLDAVLDP